MTYKWNFKPMRFNGLPNPDYKKPTTLEFESKEKFDAWHRERTVGLAEFDESMNYCKYFVREKGNKGNYVREGKSFPVDGSWTGIQDFDNYEPAQAFVKWLEENNWRNNWFELMGKYKSQ